MNLPIEATVNSQNPIFTVKKQEKSFMWVILHQYQFVRDY